jgi:hypothetical protein
MVHLAPVAREAAFHADEQASEAGDEAIILEVSVDPREDPLRVTDDYIQAQVIEAAFLEAGMDPLADGDFDENGDVRKDTPGGRFYHEWSRIVLFREARPFFSGRLEEVARAVLSSSTFVGSYYFAEETAWHIWFHSDPRPEEPGPVQDTEPYRRVLKALRAGYAAYLDALAHPWQASLATDRDPSVGFEGVIPADRIRVLDAHEVEAARAELASVGRGRGRPVPFEHWYPADPGARPEPWA